MSISILAAVTTAADKPPAIEALTLDAPGPGELLVEIRASGICHTDFLAPQIMPLPAVLGHEGAGIVRAAGDGVQGLQPGDHVVGSYGYCGHCSRCASGEPFHCQDFSSIQLGTRRAGLPALHRPDGTAVNAAFFEQSSFATHALMTARNAIKVPQDIPFAQLAPLGCGVITGYGAVRRVLAAKPGQSIAVMGVGGVGLAAVMAARLAGCGPIIAVDIKRSRLDAALGFGATHAVDASNDDAAAQIRAICAGGADLALETVGQASSLNHAIESLRSGGRCGVIAVPNLGRAFEVRSGRPLLTIDLVGVIEGRADPRVMIPELAALVRSGDLPLDRYTTTFEFSQIAEALEAAKSGQVAKAVLVMP